MAINEDDEILQDFLVETEEILEQLGEQLVELEQCPRDIDLLNAVFRGFHTIKGGAGFLNLTPLVEVCHRAEDVFNLLRQSQCVVDAHLMDLILQVLDVVNEMMAKIRAGGQPSAAEPSLLKELETITQADGSVVELPVAQSGGEQSPAQEEHSVSHDAVEAPAAQDAVSDDEITDEEFEDLLDQLHGSGAPGTHADFTGGGDAGISAGTSNTNDDINMAQAGPSDEITEEEFEALLDQLHGGGAPGSPVNKSPRDEHTEHMSPAEEEKAIKENAAAVAPENEKPGAGKKDSVQSQSAETTVRVDTKRLDDIMNLVGELVLVRNRIATLESTQSDEDLAKAVANLDLVTADLQSSVMKTRMQPIKKVFGRFPRVVRDLARSLNKEVSLELIGEDTDLDKNLVEALADPLVHLVRNAVDHGIEMPDERVTKGKPRKGEVILSAEQEGDHILLTIRDDGAGMDAEKLRTIAVEKGLIDIESAERLSPEQCYQLIFMPGFSSKSEITDISGRGVGMDVVKTRISQLNGSITISSQPGNGSRIAIKVPLTLAIMPTLMVMLGKQIFALPLVSVVEIFHLDLTRTNMVDGQLVVLVRDKPLPIFYLNQWLTHGAEAGLSGKSHVVVVNAGTQQVGFVVNQLIGQEEVVIKPLGALLHGTRGLAGATITGNGRIALILDVPSLMSAYANG